MSLKELYEARDMMRAEKKKLVEAGQTLTEQLKAPGLTEEESATLNEKSSILLKKIETYTTKDKQLSQQILQEEEETTEKVEAVASVTDMARHKPVSTARTMEDYLGSKKALDDFANAILVTADAEPNKADFNKAWVDALGRAGVLNEGIENPEILYPVPVVRAITDAFDAAGSIWATFNHRAPFTKWKTAYNQEEGPASRARGFKRGADKKEQEIDLVDRLVASQYVYKYITIDKEILRETRDTGAILRYVLGELPQRIVRELERAAILGDGRPAADADKINSFVPMALDVAPYAGEIIGTGDLYVDLINANVSLKSEGNRYLVTSKQYVAAFMTKKDSTGRLLFLPGTPWNNILGVTTIFTPDWYPQPNTEGIPDAVLYRGQAYYTVGDNTIENFENFILAKNKYEYLAEIYAGGSLMEMQGAVRILPPAESVKK